MGWESDQGWIMEDRKSHTKEFNMNLTQLDTSKRKVMD
jgi:hypothetical protein